MATTGYWCTDCEMLVEPVKVYECYTDNWLGDERQCAQCSKFVPLAYSEGCESCFAEVEEVEVVTDHDGEVIRAEDYEPEGKSLAQRKKDKAAAVKKAHKEQAKAELDTLLSQTTETTWGSISVGQKVVAKDWKGNIDPKQSATLLSVTTVGEKCAPPLVPGSLITLTEHYGLRLEVHAPDETVLIKEGEPGTESLPSASERFRVTHGSDTHGTGIKLVSANVSLAATDSRNIYIGEISGKNSAYSTFQTIVGAFHLPEEARAFAVSAREAASQLAQNILFDEEEPLEVELTESDDILSHIPVRHANFLVGTDDMLGGEGVRVSTMTSGRSTQSFAVLSPAVLEGIAVAADLIADKLTALIDPKE